MINWLSSMFASLAYDAAIYSAGLASHGGMCQMKEPEILKQEAKHIGKIKKFNR